MDVMRVALFAGLVFHKLVWEVLKPRRKGAHVKEKTSPNMMLLIVKGIKMGVLVFLLIQTLFLEIFPILSNPAILQVVGCLVYLVGLATAVFGRIHLGENWVDLEEYQVIPEQSLVTKGVYQYIRHPIYAGDLFLILGLQLALNSWLVLMVIPLFVLIYRQTSAEEGVLAQAFPGYEDYCRRTKRFIPFVI